VISGVALFSVDGPGLRERVGDWPPHHGSSSLLRSTVGQWRNWKTHRVWNPASGRICGFASRLPHNTLPQAGGGNSTPPACGVRVSMFVYLDESGDTGFKFNQGSTRYFVVTLLLTTDPIPLQSAVEQVRAALHYPSGTEFKFSKSSVAVREAFLNAINPFQFQVRALIADKETITRPYMHNKETFYNYFVRLVLDYDYGSISGATLILDESFRSRRSKEELRTYLRRQLNEGHESPKLVKIMYHRSHSDYLLQVSDMACGAIYAAYNKNEPRYRKIIKRHIQDEWPLRPYQ